MERELRRQWNNLYTSGTGVMLFACWTILKYIIEYFLSPETFFQSVDPNTSEAVKQAAFLLVLAILVTDLILRAIVGFSARAEGRGKKKGSGYLVLAVIILFFTIFGYFATMSAFFIQGYLLRTIISLIMDVTSTIVLILVLISAIKARRIQKQMAEQN